MKIRISKAYGEQKVFENFALTIDEGEILCVLGESGCGKTTLLNALANLTEFQGETENLPKQVGYIFQEPRLLPNLSVEGNLKYALEKVSQEQIDEILQKTEIISLRHKRPKELSGGEKQRVAVARAFLSDAPLLLLDEPFSSLDTALKIRLCNVFVKLWEEKRPTVVFVTHDLEEALMLGHRIIVLKKGESVADIRPNRSKLPLEYGEDGKTKAELLKILLDK